MDRGVVAPSDSPAVPEASERGAKPARGDIRVLFKRPEICMAETGGTILLVMLTNMHTEWLHAVQAAHLETALRYGGPRPFIALSKIDKRFPLEIGFDQNLHDLRVTLDQMRRHIAACAVVVSFGGILGFTMRRALQLVCFLSPMPPPMQAFFTTFEAVCWIEPYLASSAVDPFDRAHFLEALEYVEFLLGSSD